MKVLLDTNILIYRESRPSEKENIWGVFFWLEKLKYDKFIHPLSIEEIEQYGCKETIKWLSEKLSSYNIIKTENPLHQDLQKLWDKIDHDENSKNDTRLLNEVFIGKIDILISEDKWLIEKSKQLLCDDKVFTINSFLEKVTLENPELIDYNVLAVKKEFFWHLDLKDSFFESLIIDYTGFKSWFTKKSEDISYVCKNWEKICAFLYIKVEEKDSESYSDIAPVLLPRKRLKIWTFKVTHNWFRLWERFLKIIFDNALEQKVEEIYVTIFDRTEEQKALISLLSSWGFKKHGYKFHENWQKELVLIRDFSRTQDINLENPKQTFPFFSHTEKNIFIAPIYPDYHTDLFPDSILTNEQPSNFQEHEPHRNALEKVYISRSIDRSIEKWDLLMFYRTSSWWLAIHTGVLTTICIVNDVIIPETFEEFAKWCKNKSVFDPKSLEKQWNWKPKYRPFIVKILHFLSLKTPKPTLKRLIENEIIKDTTSVPRWIKKTTWKNLSKILQYNKENN